MSRPSPSPVRVLHLLAALRPSGMERMLVSAAAHFRDQDVENTVLGHGAHHPYADTLREAGYHVVLAPEAVTTGAGFRVLRQTIRSRSIDVVHIHTESDYLRTVLAVRAAAGRDVGLVRTVHSVFAASGTWWLKRQVQARLADPLVRTVVAPSSDVASHERAFGRRPAVVWNWVDDSFFELRAERERQTAERTDAPVALIVGNCSPGKRHELALRAVLDSGYRLMHLGDETHATVGERELLDSLDRQGRLAIRGVHDAVHALPRADVFLMPSRHEGMGVALAEAVVAGVPALASDSPGLRWAARFPSARCVSDDGWAAALRNPPTSASLISSGAGAIDFSAARGSREYAELYRSASAPHTSSAGHSPAAGRAGVTDEPSSGTRHRVAIVQPWLPQYRDTFYRELITRARERGIAVDVYYGDPPPEWRERHDTLTASYARHVPTVVVPVRGRSLLYKPVRAQLKEQGYSLIVLEQAVRNLETYRLLLDRTPLAFWGHGRTYTVPTSAVQESVKRWLTRRGRWFFAYTPGGADAVNRAGFPPERITVVMNSVDTAALRADLDTITDDETEAFRAAHGVGDHTALFIGGLDEAKRLPFLLEAARLAHELDERFHLLVAGDGDQRGLVESAAQHSNYVHYLGGLHGREKALAMASCQVLAMPGRVGLVAVDSFVTGRPIVTTNWRWHAPEFEYLEDGRNAVVTADDVSDFAQGLTRVLQAKPELAALSARCAKSAGSHGTEQMAQRFLDGLVAALDAPRP